MYKLEITQKHIITLLLHVITYFTLFNILKKKNSVKRHSKIFKFKQNT